MGALLTRGEVVHLEFIDTRECCSQERTFSTFRATYCSYFCFPVMFRWAAKLGIPVRSSPSSDKSVSKRSFCSGRLAGEAFVLSLTLDLH